MGRHHESYSDWVRRVRRNANKPPAKERDCWRTSQQIGLGALTMLAAAVAVAGYAASRYGNRSPAINH